MQENKVDYEVEYNKLADEISRYVHYCSNEKMLELRSYYSVADNAVNIFPALKRSENPAITKAFTENIQSKF